MQNNADVHERIKSCAVNADRLIASLSTLAENIDSAAARGDIKIAGRYQEEFDMAAIKFMGNVEAIVDDYYQLGGKKRSRLANEPIPDFELERIHSAVLEIVDTMPMHYPQAPPAQVAEPVYKPMTPVPEKVQPSQEKPQKPSHRVDITG